MFLTVDTIETYWRTILLALCKPVYQLIVYVYELFEVVGTAEILTNDALTTIYNRVGMLLGVYMMFRIIFSFIQMLINPDYITDKEKGVGKIIVKVVLTILLIAITPFLFEKAMDIQKFVVGSSSGENIIANILLPGGSKMKGGQQTFGVELSAYLFESFYKYDKNMLNSGVKGECEALDEYDGVTNLHKSIMNSGGDISFAKICLDKSWTDQKEAGKDKEKYEITFSSNGVFALIVGVIVCYILFTYTLMAGVRVIQLVFLRIVAPMAILTYMSPKKDTMFSKWLKMCTTTYLDLFIRMAIIYFAIFIIQALMGGNGIALQNQGYQHQWIVDIVMIIALLIFAKKAPDLLKELFPSTGGAASLGFFSSPKKLFDSMIGGGILNKGYDKLTGFAKTLPYRAYGAASVGLGASALAARRGIGKSLDLGKEYNAKKKELKDSGMSDKEIKEQMKSWRKENHVGRQLWRTTGGAIGTGIRGMGRGLGTTNHSQRKTASLNTANATKSRYKVRDAGYSFGDQFRDKARGFVGRDQGVEDLTAANTAAIQGLNYRITGIMQEKGNDMAGYSVQESKSDPGKFLIIGSSGAIEGGKFFTKEGATKYFRDLTAEDANGNAIRIVSDEAIDTIFTVSDLNKQVGKLQSQNSALQQKANEQKPQS